MKKYKFEIFIVIVLILTHVAASLTPPEKLLRWYTTDDAFYYFKVAQNIGEGHGSTFDRFGSTNGYHPLWMLVCIPVFTLARFDLFLPLRVLVIIMGVFHAATGVLLYRITKKFIAQPISMAVALLWTFSPFVHKITAQNGLEAGISAFFTVLTLYLLAELKTNGQPASTKQLVLISLAGTLAVLSRLDNIFVMTMLGIWLIFRSSPIRYYLSLDILAIAASVLLSCMARFGLGQAFYQYGRSALVMIAIGIILKGTIGYFFGLYQPPLSTPIITRLMRVAKAISIGSASTAIVMLGLVKGGLIDGFPRMVLLMDWGVSFLLIAGIRLTLDWLALGRITSPTRISPLETLRLHGKSWLRSGVIYFGILGMVLMAYMGWNYAQFGTPTPVSGQIKEWWGTIHTAFRQPTQKPAIFFGIDTRFIVAPSTDPDPEVTLSRKGPWVTGLSWLMWPTRFLSKAFTPVIWILFGLIGLALLKVRRTGAVKITDQGSLLPLIAGCMLQVWFYNTRGYVAMREWYWVAELIFTCLATCIALDCLIRVIQQQRYRNFAAIAVLIIMCVVVMREYTGMVEQRIFRDADDPENESYLALVKNLEDSTETGSVIGMTGGGDMAYFIHDRTIVNLDGLINSYTYFTALKNHQAAEYLASINLDYVFGKAGILTETEPYIGIFKRRLIQINFFNNRELYQFTYETSPN